MTAEVEALLARVTSWAAGRPDVVAVALVGSRARGTAGADSDVDLVVLTGDPDGYRGGAWAVDVLGEASDVRTRRWGPLLERRFRLPGGLEVEVGVAPPSWAALPADPGTARVVAAGCLVLHDPSGLLTRLIGAVAAQS